MIQLTKFSYAYNVGETPNAGEHGKIVGIAAGNTSVCSRAIVAMHLIGSGVPVGA